MPDRPSGRELVRVFDSGLRIRFSIALRFLEQAAAAFDGESTIGTSILCRATLEATYITFFQHAKKAADGKGYELVNRTQLVPGQNKPADRIRFGPVMQAIRESGVLSPEQLRASMRVHENGNWVAHIVERRAEELRRPSSWMDWKPWIDEDQAWADLQDTVDIVRPIETALPSIYK